MFFCIQAFSRFLLRFVAAVLVAESGVSGQIEALLVALAGPTLLAVEDETIAEIGYLLKLTEFMTQRTRPSGSLLQIRSAIIIIPSPRPSPRGSSTSSIFDRGCTPVGICGGKLRAIVQYLADHCRVRGR